MRSSQFKSKLVFLCLQASIGLLEEKRYCHIVWFWVYDYQHTKPVSRARAKRTTCQVKLNLQLWSRKIESISVDSFLRTIGFFLHFEKPGQISLTRESSIYAVNMSNNENSNFLMNLKYKLLESDDASLDFFVPLGSSGKPIHEIYECKLNTLKVI